MAVQVASIRSGLRDSQYGVLLRVPADRLPNLHGTNSWGGTNSFQDLFVQNLYVQQTLEIYDANVDISAGASAQLGTADPWDFWLKSNGIARLGVTSAGAYLFTSSQPSSVFTTVLFTDAFTRADEYPLGGWTTQAGASALRLSANAVHASAGGALAIGAGYPTTDTWDLSAADAQALISGDGAVSDRTGVSVFMASGGASGYDVVFQQNVDQIQIRKRTSPTADSSLGSFASQGHFGTLRALASAGTTTTWISAFKNGAYVGVGTDSSSPYRVGFAGLRMGSDNPPTGRTFADDFVHNSTTAPPFGTGDIVWQTSASLWDMLGATGATKHAQVFSDSLQLGFSKPVVFTGLTSAFVSAGTSAYFNTATYGVVRLASGVGTTGLSGVVGFSAAGAAQFSAVANDLVLLKTDVYGLSGQGSPVSGASGVVQVSGGTGITVSAVGTNLLLVSGAALSPSATWAAAAASASAAAFYAGTLTAPGLNIIGSPSAGLYSPSAGTLAIAASGIELMRWTLEHPASAFIGISQPTPAFALDVSGYRMNFDGPNTNAILVRAPNVAGNVVAFQAGLGGTSAATAFQITGDLLFFTASASAAGTRPQGHAWLRVNDQAVGLVIPQVWHGNPIRVGIATTAPTETLQVAGTFQLSAVASANLPAASATRDGMLIVDLTASALVIYANAQRLSAAFTAF